MVVQVLVKTFSVGDSSIVFEGATDDELQTTLAIIEPTADRTITFPDGAGTVAFTTMVILVMLQLQLL